MAHLHCVDEPALPNVLKVVCTWSTGLHALLLTERPSEGGLYLASSNSPPTELTPKHIKQCFAIPHTHAPAVLALTVAAQQLIQLICAVQPALPDVLWVVCGVQARMCSARAAAQQRPDEGLAD